MITGRFAFGGAGMEINLDFAKVGDSLRMEMRVGKLGVMATISVDPSENGAVAALLSPIQRYRQDFPVSVQAWPFGGDTPESADRIDLITQVVQRLQGGGGVPAKPCGKKNDKASGDLPAQLPD